MIAKVALIERMSGILWIVLVAAVILYGYAKLTDSPSDPVENFENCVILSNRTAEAIRECRLATGSNGSEILGE